MLKQKSGFRRIFLAVWLLPILLISVGMIDYARAAADATYHAGDYRLSNGTHLSGGVSSLQAVDSDYFASESVPQATSNSSHNPANYTLLGGTSYVSGATEDLASSDNVQMVFRSHASALSAQALYAHQETTTIAGNIYSTHRSEEADSTGTDLSASMNAIGRRLWAKFVYPLSGIDSIPTSTWTGFYRAWTDSIPSSSIAHNGTGSGNNGAGSTSVSWSHNTGLGSNRIMIVGVSIRDTTVYVSSITYGLQSLTLIRSDTSGTFVRSELWYLIAPTSGTATVTVTLSGTSRATGGSCTYTGVAQASPIEANAGGFGKSSSPSQSLTVNTANSWLLGHLAITGSDKIVSSEGGSQTTRWDQVTSSGVAADRNQGHGSDKGPVGTGSQSMSWTISGSEDYAVSVVALKPASPAVGHADVDILIRQSDGTVRTTIATNVGNSANLSATVSTLSGTYSWVEYVVVDEADFLEIDYYVDIVTPYDGMWAYLRIDDDALPVTNQTRVADITLPNEFTAEVEFTALSNTFSLAQICWSVESAWTVDSVATTLQLYNYSSWSYPTNGEGFIGYTSNATANTDEARIQVIAVNPQHLRDSEGYWRIKVKGVKATRTPFDFKGDLIELTSTYYTEYTVSTEFLFTSIANDALVHLNFTVVSEYDVADVSVTVQAWNFSSSAYVDGGQGYLRYISFNASETRLLSIDTNQQFYTSNGGAQIRVTSLSTTAPHQQKIDQIKLDCRIAGTLWLLTWPTVFLIAIPAPLAVLLLLLLVFRRRRKSGLLIRRKMTAFSEQFGMTHEQLLGRKALLEVDPASDYNLALSGFVSEARNNGESLFILTNRNSALHSVFSMAGNANFLLLTSKTHYSQRINESETILPESDISVLLDTLVKTQQTHADERIDLLFDNVSDIILRCGFEKTYKFIRMLLEALSSSKTTALFVFIPSAHDQEVASSIRGLFQCQLTYTKDGPRT